MTFYFISRDPSLTELQTPSHEIHYTALSTFIFCINQQVTLYTEKTRISPPVLIGHWWWVKCKDLKPAGLVVNRRVMRDNVDTPLSNAAAKKSSKL